MESRASKTCLHAEPVTGNPLLVESSSVNTETIKQFRLSSNSQRILSSHWSKYSSDLESACLICRCLTTITGHLGPVSAVAAHGEHLYSASLGSDIRVWQQPELVEACCRFGCGEGSLKAILLTEHRVYSAHQDHKIRVWRRLPTQPLRHKLVATLPTTKDCLIKSLSQKNYVHVRRHHKSLWIRHVDTISVLAMGKSNKLLYSGSWDKTFKVWRVSDLKCMESVKAHDDAINALVVGSDGFVYTGSADSKIKTWVKKRDDKKHSLVSTLDGHTCAVNALALSVDGAVLYSGDSDGSIFVWDVSTGKITGQMRMLQILKGHRSAVLCLCTVGDNLLCSGSADTTVRVWRRDSSHSGLAVLQGHTSPVKSLATSGFANEEGTGCLVYSGSIDKSIKVWWISMGKEEEECDVLSCVL